MRCFQGLQSWQDCHGAYRSMLFGMSVVLVSWTILPSHCSGAPSDHPMGDPDMAIYHETLRSVQYAKLMLIALALEDDLQT